VGDMEVSLGFYKDVLGLPLERRMRPGPDMDIAFLGAGETKVELIWSAGRKNQGFGTDISLGFEVPSLDAAMEELKRKGVAIASGPFQPNPTIRFFYVLDPDGLRIQLVENVRPA